MQARPNTRAQSSQNPTHLSAIKDALIQAGRRVYFYELLGGGWGARLSRIAPLFLTSALFAYKFLVEYVPAANAIADDVGSFDSVRLSPHYAQDDSYFQRQDHS